MLSHHGIIFSIREETLKNEEKDGPNLKTGTKDLSREQLTV